MSLFRIHFLLPLHTIVAPGGWVLSTGIWDNSKYWDNTAIYRNN